MSNIFETIAAFAQQLRDIDPRITYLPLSLQFDERQGSGRLPHVSATMAVSSEEAVRELAERFGLNEPSWREIDDVRWLAAGKWIDFGGVNMHVEFSGPHRKVAAAATSEVAS